MVEAKPGNCFSFETYVFNLFLQILSLCCLFAYIKTRQSGWTEMAERGSLA